MLSARQIAITALNLLPGIPFIDSNGNVDYPSVIVYTNEDIYTFKHIGPNQWNILSDVEDEYILENVNTNTIIRFINLMSGISVVAMYNHLDYRNLSDDVVLYRCIPEQGHPNCESKIEPAIKTIQRRFRRGRQQQRRQTRKQISAELTTLPPSSLLPSGGVDYQSGQQRGLQYGMRP